MRDRLLQLFANLALHRPWTVVITAVVLAVIAGTYAAYTLKLNANTDDLVARDRPYMADFLRLIEEFGDLEHLYVVVENTGDVAKTHAAIDALTARLRQIPDLPGVYSSIEVHEQLRLASRAMSEAELADLVLASDAFPYILQADPSRAVERAQELLTALIRSGVNMPQQEQERTGAAAVFLLNAVAAALPNSPSREQLGALIGNELQNEYFASDTGRFYFITIVPVKDYGTLSVIEEPLRQIRAAIAVVQRTFPDVTFGLTGKPVLQADEMATTNADMTKASLVAIVLCAALFMWSFGGIWKPALAVLAFACGAAWTYGFAAITIGQLNLLSIVFMLVLIGVGLDYGVHVLSRYRESRMQSDAKSAIASAVVAAGRGNFTGAITSSVVFFMALLTTFQGLRELGLIAGGGLLLCVVAMTLVLPALVVIVDRHQSQPLAHAFNPKSKISATADLPAARQNPKSHSHFRPKLILSFIAVFTIALLFAPGAWRFEQNLLELQAEGLESVEWERRILDDSAAASWFAAVIAENPQDALAVIARAQQQPAIGAIRSAFDLIQPPSAQRDALRAQLHSAQTFDDVAPDADDALTANELQIAASGMNLIATGAASRAPEEAARLIQISNDLNTIADQMRSSDEAAEEVRQRINATISQIASSLQLMLEGDRLSERDALPDALRQQFISPLGSYLVMMHPSQNVWEYEPMKQFIDAIRTVDARATGAPITHFESLGEMYDAFLLMAILSLVVIAVVVWIDFRSVKFAALALVPTIVGLLWLVEAMALLGISFNLANFFSVPILVGLSVDGSVHILHRHREGGGVRASLGATRKAVIITALTTTIGFGAVMLAHHRGLNSLGQVMALGSLLCLLATVVVLPALLAVIERRPSHGAKSVCD